MPFGIAASSVIAEFSSSEGTTSYILDGPLPRSAPFRDFFTAGEAVSYEADDQGGLIEFGTGRFGIDDSLSREAITWSSTGGLINWPEGRRIIKATVPISLAISSFWNGTVADSEVIARYVFAVAARIPVNLTGSQAACETAPANAATFAIKLNGASIGSIVFPQGVTSATFYLNNLVNCLPGDVLTITGPAVHDPVIANLAFNIQAVGGSVVSVTAVSTLNVSESAAIATVPSARAIYVVSSLEQLTPADTQSQTSATGVTAKSTAEIASISDAETGSAIRPVRVTETTVNSDTPTATSISRVVIAEVAAITSSQNRGGTITAKSVFESGTLLDFASYSGAALSLAGTWAGTIGADETLMRYVFTMSATLNAGLPGSVANCVAPAVTTSTVLTIRKNGAAVGTITYATSAITGALAMASTTSFVAGDILSITGPSSPDATLSDISWNLQPTGGVTEAISGLWNGTVGPNNIIARHLFASSVTIPTNFVGSRAIAQSPGVGSTTVFTVRRNAVNIGTLTFSVGNTSGTFSLASPASFVSGDTIFIVAPAAPDGVIGNLAWNIQTTAGTAPIITGEWNGTLNASETLVRYVFTRSAILPGPVSLSLTVNPPNPTILVDTPGNTQIATLTGSWSDGRVFGGTFAFAAPYFDDGGIYAITQSAPGAVGYLIVNPDGPGVGSTATIEDVTMVANDTGLTILQGSRFICGGNSSLTLTVTPPNPIILADTPGNTQIATLTGSWGDGSAFGGTFAFAPPYFDDGGIYAITQSAPGAVGYLIVNPTGPGVGPNATIEDVTIVANDTMTGTATASTVFTIAKNGASIGTATFAAGEIVATVSIPSAVMFAAGDILTITSPATPDATLADLAWNIVTT